MLGLCLALFAIGAEPPAGPAFVRHAAGADDARGAIQSIDKTWAVRLAGESEPTAGADLVSLRRADLQLPPYPATTQVIFANGDRLAADVLGIENDQIRIRAAFADPPHHANATQELTAPLAAVAEIWFQPPPENEAARPKPGERRRRDVMYLTNGDARTGTVVGMKSHTQPLIFKEGSKETQVDPMRLVAVAMNTDLARTLRPRGPYGRLVLANGGRLSLLSATASGESLTGKTLFGPEVKVPIDQIISLDIRQGKAVYLSDLKPLRYEHTPFLGVRWSYEADRSVAGRDMRLGGHAFDKGVGMHSESRLTYALAGGYRWFKATVGLDDRTGQGGSVRVRVLVDGAEKDGNDNELTAATGPRTVRVDVAGAKELTLVVEFGSGGDVCDHVDWADARLVK